MACLHGGLCNREVQVLFLDIGIVVTALIIAAIIAVPLYRRLPVWRAVITPLASIIGSGFLVLGPILDAGFGKFAPIVMVRSKFAWPGRFIGG